MIYVDRSLNNPPAGMTVAGKELLNRVKEERSGGGTRWLQRGLTRFWRGPFRDLATELARDTFKGKCAYCESRIDSTKSNFDIDHFRPKSRAIGLDGKVSHFHYWWLIADWNNLYLSCATCSANKASHFPVEGKRAKENAVWQDTVEFESGLLIAPCVDKPIEHLDFHEDGQVRSATQRGNVTIEILDLNRSSLVSARREAAAILKLAIKNGNDSLINKVLSPDAEFLAVKRAITENALQGSHAQAVLNALGSRVSNLVNLEKRAAGTRSKVTPKVARYLESVSQLERIEIRNIRAIKHMDLAFLSNSGSAEPWVVLIGENGVGKSSILKAISLLFASSKERAYFIPDARSCVTKGSGARSGSVRAWFSHKPDEAVELRFSRSSKVFKRIGKPPRASFLAYGATRLPPDPSHCASTTPNPIRIGNLFDPRKPLSDIEKFFFKYQTRRSGKVQSSRSQPAKATSAGRRSRTHFPPQWEAVDPWI